MLKTIFRNSILRGCLQLMSRPLYLISVIAIPLVTAIFFITLMDRGMADQVPSAVVDLDHTETSRELTRNLEALQTVKIDYKLESYTQAMDYLKSGKIMGFFVIPSGFANKALAARQPELTYYLNFAYYVPGSLLVKGYNTLSAVANGSVIKGTLTTMGVSNGKIGSTLQPYHNDIHPLNNPWLNYGVYLSNSFVPGVLALMVMLMTVYTITEEIKMKTSVEWLHQSGDSILVAIFGKLLPQTLLFTLVGWIILALFFGPFAGYPMNGNLGNMLLAMFLMVVASQGFAVLACCIVPNLRFALSLCGLTSILAFSICGYSFPVENMYSGIGIFSYIVPIRYYFLIYIDQALNGLGFVYSRYYYAALLVFPLLSLPLLNRLKKACLKPVYAP